jgi:uncharacterized cysteine cluster protein YcgN (CxxCxxCC family)
VRIDTNVQNIKGAEMEFWKITPMEKMSPSQWESLCDSCGQCCLHRLEDEDTGEQAVTNVSCKYLDLFSCQCTDYTNRQKNVPDCMKITPENVREQNWLPDTCGYRRVAKGRDLPSWHPLKSGDPNTVHTQGPGMRDQLISEDEIEGSVEDYIVAIISGDDD